jgi:SAM-dependent methyltransferase
VTATGNLSIEAQPRYDHIKDLILRDVPPPARVVELGSAPGDQIVEFAKLGYQATSVDIGVSADAWGSGEEGRMAALLREHGVRDVTWDLEQVPYPLEDHSFDVVIMTEVYEHLRDYPVRSLQEVRRILAPNGRLYFTTPNTAYVMNRFKALAGRTSASSIADWIGGIPHARHAREYTFAEIDEVMRYAGLTVIESYSRHFHLHSGRTSTPARLVKSGLAQLAKVRRTLGPSIVVVAQP